VADYQIWYSDAFGRGRRRLAEWSRLVASRRLNRLGALKELLLPLDTAPAVLTQRDARIEIWRNGSPLMDTLYFVRRFGYTERDGMRYLRLGGYDALYHLDGRIVAAHSTSPSAVKSGPADDVIKAYVRENFGSLTVDEDRDASLHLTVAEDVGAAPVIYRRAARQNLGRLIRGICFESAQRGTPLYVDLVLRPDGLLELQTFTGARGVDHRRSGLGPVAVSVGIGTLAESDRTRDYSDEHTVVYVGGRGLREQRQVIEVEDAARSKASPWGRREIWFDARHLSTTDALTSSGNELLWQGLPDERIVGVAGSGFGDRWGFGDLVEAAFDEDVADCRIDECEVTLDEQCNERAILALYELTAEAALLSVAQRVDDIGSQESPEYSEVPAPYSVPLAGADGTLQDGWLSVAIARLAQLTWGNITGKPSTFPPGGTAGGNLNGTYPNPIVLKIRNRTVSNDSPNDTDYLGWDEATQQWKPMQYAVSGLQSLYTIVPSFLTVTGANPTHTGNLTIALVNQSPNLVFAGPSSGAAAAPTFRALMKVDIADLETITVTPAPSAVPKAGAGGTIADTWLSSLIPRLTAAGYLGLNGTPEEYLYARGTIDTTAVHLVSDHGPGTVSHAYLVTGESGVSWQAAIVSLNWHGTGSGMARRDTSTGGGYVRILPGSIDLDVVSAAGADTRILHATSAGVSVGTGGYNATRQLSVEASNGYAYIGFTQSGAEKFVIGEEMPSSRFIIYSNAVSNYPMIILTGGAVGIGKSPGITNFGDLDVAGRVNADGGIISQAWQTPTLLNGWVNFGSGYNSAGYWKDSFGVVHLRGLIKSGTATAGTVIFTLPAGYRPPAIELLQVQCYTSTYVIGRVDIQSGGNVVFQTGGNTFLSLDGLTFRVS